MSLRVRQLTRGRACSDQQQQAAAAAPDPHLGGRIVVGDVEPQACGRKVASRCSACLPPRKFAAAGTPVAKCPDRLGSQRPHARIGASLHEPSARAQAAHCRPLPPTVRHSGGLALPHGEGVAAHKVGAGDVRVVLRWGQEEGGGGGDAQLQGSHGSHGKGVWLSI